MEHRIGGQSKSAGDFPILSGFILVWFGQNWPDLDGPSDVDLIRKALIGASSAERVGLHEDIDRFLASGFTDDRMKQIINHEWRAGYYDELQGRFVADWLEKVRYWIARIEEVPPP